MTGDQSSCGTLSAERRCGGGRGGAAVATSALKDGTAELDTGRIEAKPLARRTLIRVWVWIGFGMGSCGCMGRCRVGRSAG